MGRWGGEGSGCVVQSNDQLGVANGMVMRFVE